MSTSSTDRGTQTEGEPSEDHSPASSSRQRNYPVTKTTEHVNDSDDQDETSKSVSENGEAKPVIAKASVVTIPRRLPPALPPRNPQRVASPTELTPKADGFDDAALSPSKPPDGFDDVSLNESQASNYDHPEGFANPIEDEAKDAWKDTTDAKTPNEGAGPDEFHSIPSSPAVEKKDEREDFS